MENIWFTILVSSIVFIVFVVAIFALYFVMSRRGMKQQRRHFEQLHQDLQVGKQVICAQGIYGVVKKIDQEKAEIEIAKGLVITVSRYAISDIVND